MEKMSERRGESRERRVGAGSLKEPFYMCRHTGMTRGPVSGAEKGAEERRQERGARSQINLTDTPPPTLG